MAQLVNPPSYHELDYSYLPRIQSHSIVHRSLAPWTHRSVDSSGPHPHSQPQPGWNNVGTQSPTNFPVVGASCHNPGVGTGSVSSYFEYSTFLEVPPQVSHKVWLSSLKGRCSKFHTPIRNHDPNFRKNPISGSQNPEYHDLPAYLD